MTDRWSRKPICREICSIDLSDERPMRSSLWGAYRRVHDVFPQTFGTGDRLPAPTQHHTEWYSTVRTRETKNGSGCPFSRFQETPGST